MPRCEMEVKWEVSLPVGERMPGGRFSLESPPLLAPWPSSRGGVLWRWSVCVTAGGPDGSDD
jgi:hypothetical protein